ncbi:MAG: response regulator [Candidatus Rokuibacteriota bacterium]
MPVLEDVRDVSSPVAAQEPGFEFLLRDLLQRRQLVGDPSNALDAEPLPAPVSDRPTVLVVDDDSTLLATLADMLGRGFRVVTAASGADAIATFKTTPVDVVVTDLAMPGMNGLQVARQCKAIRPSVPVLMVTAWESLVGPEDAAAHGIDGILTKPVRAAALVRAIQGLLE